jgi:hypothetical protein
MNDVKMPQDRARWNRRLTSGDDAHRLAAGVHVGAGQLHLLEMISEIWLEVSPSRVNSNVPLSRISRVARSTAP